MALCILLLSCIWKDPEFVNVICITGIRVSSSLSVSTKSSKFCTSVQLPPWYNLRTLYSRAYAVDFGIYRKREEEMDQFVVHKCFGPLAMEKRGNSKYQQSCIVPGVVLSTTSIHCL